MAGYKHSLNVQIKVITELVKKEVAKSIVVSGHEDIKDGCYKFGLLVIRGEKGKLICLAELASSLEDDAWKYGNPVEQLVDLFTNSILDMLMSGESPIQKEQKESDRELAICTDNINRLTKEIFGEGVSFNSKTSSFEKSED